MHLPASMVLRVNSLKAATPEVTNYLSDVLIKYKVLDNKHGVEVEQRMNLFASQIFKEGWVEVQDYASQQVGLFVKPAPGDWVIDACAGGGGKALHLAALMQNKGRIVALDTDQYKLENLKKDPKGQVPRSLKHVGLKIIRSSKDWKVQLINSCSMYPVVDPVCYDAILMLNTESPLNT